VRDDRSSKRQIDVDGVDTVPFSSDPFELSFVEIAMLSKIFASTNTGMGGKELVTITPLPFGDSPENKYPPSRPAPLASASFADESD
jgi:hypothetical protein